MQLAQKLLFLFALHPSTPSLFRFERGSLRLCRV
jgi:hypothetical protein